ncbi:MAG: hypothetical protein EZS28_016842 [Streblomastix strix]|uniref:Uncharacterized protein n=1 Tax=Streblomastix strix TaxID=222440 RepID=A0A5J4VZD8_9EUKA|nr:MAG: hypothetical protein EZS28_016842 [Streblomastix strix]
MFTSIRLYTLLAIDWCGDTSARLKTSGQRIVRALQSTCAVSFEQVLHPHLSSQSRDRLIPMVEYSDMFFLQGVQIVQQLICFRIASHFAFIIFIWTIHIDGQINDAPRPYGPFGNLKIMR